jgi:hypothetical protein
MVEIRPSLFLSPSLPLYVKSLHRPGIAAYSWWLTPKRLYAEQLATVPTPHFGWFNGDPASAELAAKTIGSVKISSTHHVLMS